MLEKKPLDIPRPERADPWQGVADALKATPGEWRRIAGDLSTASTNITTGVLAAFRPAGSYEARRTVANGLEARYVAFATARS